MNRLQEQLKKALDEREQEKLLRKLFVDEKGADFLTNDYLGFAKLIKSGDEIENAGTSGSRLLGGNNRPTEELESMIAAFHGFESALFYQSGFTANVGLFSCLLSRHDTYIYDASIHASVRDGMRLSLAKNFSFAHNDVEDLAEKLQHARGKKVVAVEAVYSMEGDSAPLKEIIEVCRKYEADLIVDEAHSIGIFGREGRGRVEAEGLLKQVFAVVYTYGKAMGCHGGAIAGPKVLKDYLVNFSRPFIYTTAPSLHQVNAVKTAYGLLQSPVHEKNRLALRKNILFFAETFESQFPGVRVLRSHINKFTAGDLDKTILLAAGLRQQGYICRPVLSPTVEKGQEGIRLNLHTYNTMEEINGLVLACKQLLS